ncbi:amino acid ABC transporter permease [Castellaniella defragrans]|jgi:polar amino acid transport system permease protein|uniref:Polar amino acid ABC transporter, inner membrane subunit n=2 Tax=Castellaniella defragrans TaxID=75697 RepID=W8X0B8_CASD6|nr:amino acid ABC transporter permease [Castellaniella defragrans]KAB0610742.1 amino acid ABC transporter permease [Castellaniella defragrans]MBB6083174.1 polar amino acid transport system permease protein [Castellaniella defragrans]CDM25324.1 polar amino acid ABC transporter, inner membrane subunit [Castellaniella defragrans 65Phen]
MILGVTYSQWLFILTGAGWTLVLSVLGFLGGTVVGLPVAIGRASKNRLFRLPTAAYVKLIQGIPLPVIMFIVYFGISIAGYDLPALVAAGIAMTLYSSAFLGEIWRGCIEAIPHTQWEASDCLGLNKAQTLAHVILPQAFRIAIPPTVGFLVQIVKNTSYAVVIGFFDLTYSARVINNSTFKPFVVFTVAALIYFALCYPLSILSYRLERKLKRHSR